MCYQQLCFRRELQVKQALTPHLKSSDRTEVHRSPVLAISASQQARAHRGWRLRAAAPARVSTDLWNRCTLWNCRRVMIPFTLRSIRSPNPITSVRGPPRHFARKAHTLYFPLTEAPGKIICSKLTSSQYAYSQAMGLDPQLKLSVHYLKATSLTTVES